MVAENLGADRLEHEAERRLIDRDEAARIERDEEVGPTLEHAANGGGVIRIGVALVGEAVEVERRREGEDHHQCRTLPAPGVAGSSRRRSPRRCGSGRRRAPRAPWPRPVGAGEHSRPAPPGALCAACRFLAAVLHAAVAAVSGTFARSYRATLPTIAGLLEPSAGSGWIFDEGACRSLRSSGGIGAARGGGDARSRRERPPQGRGHHRATHGGRAGRASALWYNRRMKLDGASQSVRTRGDRR